MVNRNQTSSTGDAPATADDNFPAPELSQPRVSPLNQSDPVHRSSPPTLGATIKSVTGVNPISFSHSLSVKLNDKNFLIWKQQIEAVIRGHRLQKFVMDPNIPSRFLSVENEQRGAINPAYLDWEQQDQLLLSWLLSSLSDNLLTRVVGCVHSWQVWEEIHSYFSSQTRAKICQFKTELRNTKKGSRPIFEYLLRIKALIDSLISIGHSVSTQEHLEIILNSLPEEYDAFVTSINNRLDPYTIGEIESLLLSHEARLARQVQPLLSDAVSVNIVQGPPKKKASPPSYSSTPSISTMQPIPPGFQQPVPLGLHATHAGYSGFDPTAASSYPSGYRPSFPSRGGGRSRGRGGRFGGRGVLVCQVCHRTGHTASVCFHRFDHSFQPPASAYHSFQPPAPASVSAPSLIPY